ncbi:MAG: aldo/keto reductase [Faecalibacterium sp.]
METRHWEKQNIETSLLGFGCMRFPLNAEGNIDEPEAEKMLTKAYKSGINYFDTAYPYHNGDSEPFVGRFLKRYPRDSFYLATKLPIWKVESLTHAKEIFTKQLARLQTDYIDFYLLHAINEDSYKTALNFDLIPWLAELKAEGKIKNIGFSFHDNYSLFETMMTKHQWDFCQIQYNYMDKKHQAGEKGLLLAKSLGTPVITMESVRGGSIAALPSGLTAQMRAIQPDASTSSWALRWLGSQEGINVILSGMSTMEQVEDNLKTFGNFVPLSDAEQGVILNVEKKLRSRTHNTCTACQYCQPCPVGVNIPRNFAIWNNYGIFGVKQQTKFHWNGLAADTKAQQCVGCGKCETVCPQQIDIRGNLKALQIELDALVAENA